MSAYPTGDGAEFSIETINVDGQTCLVLRGEIDLTVRDPLARALAKVAAAGHRIVLDMAEVSFLDSTGIGVLARTAADGADISIVNPQRAVCRALDVSGIDHLIHIVGGDTNHERTFDGSR